MTDHEKRIREARWYSVSRFGAATLCTGQDDAIATATDSQVLYPKNGPYEATQLVPVATVSALLAELDAVRVKAARYDWLRNSSQICGSMTGRGIAMPSYETSDAQRIYLDECIDAAINGAAHD